MKPGLLSLIVHQLIEFPQLSVSRTENSARWGQTFRYEREMYGKRPGKRVTASW